MNQKEVMNLIKLKNESSTMEQAIKALITQFIIESNIDTDKAVSIIKDFNEYHDVEEIEPVPIEKLIENIYRSPVTDALTKDSRILYVLLRLAPYEVEDYLATQTANWPQAVSNIISDIGETEAPLPRLLRDEIRNRMKTFNPSELELHHAFYVKVNRYLNNNEVEPEQFDALAEAFMYETLADNVRFELQGKYGWLGLSRYMPGDIEQRLQWAKIGK